MTATPVPADLARLAPPDLPLPDLFRRACEAGADALGVERAGVWMLVNDGKLLRCVALFERSARRHGKGSAVPVADCPAYLRAVAAAPALACPDAPADPRTAELNGPYLRPHGITAVLDAPLVRDGRLVGVVCHEHTGGRREWTADELRFVRAVADLLADRMAAAEAALRTRQAPDPTPFPATAPRSSAGLGHDLRNALAEVRAHAELIALTPDLPAAVPPRVEKLTAAADRGVGLLRRLLSPERMQEETREHEPLPPR